jgi:hypothetical protein
MVEKCSRSWFRSFRYCFCCSEEEALLNADKVVLKSDAKETRSGRRYSKASKGIGEVVCVMFIIYDFFGFEAQK